MARHRNIRNFDFNEECEYDDVYGKSLDDEVAVSPSTAAEFIYQRESRETPSLSSYFDTKENSSSKQSQSNYSVKSMKAKPLSSPLATYSTVAEPKPSPSTVEIGPPPGFNKISTGVTNTSEERSIVNPNTKCGITPVRSVKKISSGAATPRMGFITTVDEEKSHSGTPSPYRTPNRSPNRSPARSPSPSYMDSPLGPSTLGTPKASSGYRSKHQKIDVLSEYKEREKSSKQYINLVVIGHVDAGKSTLMGHLLYLLGNVSKKAMHKYEQESQKLGKSSFAYAWVLDETGEERHRGITMDVAQQIFETQSKLVNLLDAPGHRDFIPNTITGAAQADVAVLVVNATIGEFEAGFEAGGQTREHAILVRSLGVRQLTVAVNKMDTVQWSESRFNDIVQKLKVFLKQAGYKESDVKYVPCSGLTGENLVNPSSVELLNQWYSGPSLLQRIDKFTTPPRPVEKSFRCCIADIFKAQGSGFSVAGRIESGYIQTGENVLVLPTQEVASIKALTVSDNASLWAVAGDQVVITVTGVDISKISTGSILCSVDHPVRVTTKFEARIIVFNIDVPITLGYPVIIHYQSVNEPAVIKKLISSLNKNTGELIKKRPRCITKHGTAVIQLEVSRPICIELYQDSKELGRFMLRARGNTIAAGVVTKIL